MSVRLGPALVLALALMCAPGSTPAQQTTLRVEFSKSPGRSAVVGMFRRDGVLYASASDLAGILDLTAAEQKSLQGLELTGPRVRLKLTASNPFVVAADAARKQTVLQLTRSVLRSAGAWFVPLRSFLAAVSPWLPARLELDEPAEALYVGRPAPVPVYDIRGVAMDTKVNGMTIRIPVSRPVRDVEHWVQRDGWLYVTVPGVTADTTALNATKREGLVRKVVAIQSPGSVQLSFRLKSVPESVELTGNGQDGEILLTLRTTGGMTPPQASDDEPALPGGGNLDRKRGRWALDVIVIDPGHGGKDPGTIGVTGVREKDITLGIALKLGKLIRKQLPDVRIVYTRSDDRFIELDRRGRIANANDGKLFISIHCNALKHKPSPTRGFEVYLLRPGRTDEAVNIAERENSVIKLEEGYQKRYKPMTDENFILVTMAQSAYMRSSETFADILQQEMEERAGVPNRGVRQAGFYVLVGASMPNVLVEAAYLSNREDERFLKSQSGQLKVAESILAAVRKYKQQYEKLLQEGRAIGQR